MTRWSKENPSKSSAARCFSLAPDWYKDAKKNGASERELFQLVKVFCVESLEKEIDDGFVQLMIDGYEA